MSVFEEASRPVLYEQENSEFSYWGKGSSFLIANSRNYYWVTAAHVLKNMGGSADSLRIFPSDKSKISLPFNEQYTVNKGATDDEDYKDIFMLRLDLADFDNSGDAPLIAQDIEIGIMDTRGLKQNDVLWIIGYPAETNFIDYEAYRINRTRSVIRAIYKGESISQHCHEIEFSTSIELNDYDGLSGSPLFYMRQIVHDGEEVLLPLLVGMLLRGTASSKIGHFVGAGVIENIVNLAEGNA
jgi:hypothetical protein